MYILHVHLNIYPFVPIQRANSIKFDPISPWLVLLNGWNIDQHTEESQVWFLMEGMYLGCGVKLSMCLLQWCISLSLTSSLISWDVSRAYLITCSYVTKWLRDRTLKQGCLIAYQVPNLFSCVTLVKLFSLPNSEMFNP